MDQKNGTGLAAKSRKRLFKSAFFGILVFASIYLVGREAVDYLTIGSEGAHIEREHLKQEFEEYIHLHEVAAEDYASVETFRAEHQLRQLVVIRYGEIILYTGERGGLFHFGDYERLLAQPTLEVEFADGQAQVYFGKMIDPTLIVGLTFLAAVGAILADETENEILLRFENAVSPVGNGRDGAGIGTKNIAIMMRAMGGSLAAKEAEGRYVPVLFLTARSEEYDKMLGLNIGADDYLTKPFSYVELVARVRALIRRRNVYDRQEEPGVDDWIKAGDLEMNIGGKYVMKQGERIEFTDIEFKILKLLMENPGRVFTIANLYEYVWEEPYYLNANNTVMVHISQRKEPSPNALPYHVLYSSSIVPGGFDVIS